MDSICEKHSITSSQGRALLLGKLLYDEGVRFIVKGIMGEICLYMERPPSVPIYCETEELRNLDNVYLAEKDGELFVVRGKHYDNKTILLQP